MVQYLTNAIDLNIKFEFKFKTKNKQTEFMIEN